MARVTCFQHIDCEGPGLLLDILKSKKIDLEIIKAYKGDSVPETLGDGLIVLGGPMGVYDQGNYPWLKLELHAIRKCLELSLPLLGICLGSQMLASVAGAQVYRGALPEVGWYPVSLTEEGRLDPLLLGLPPEFMAFHWHGDTFTLPPDAVRLARSSYYPEQVFKVGKNAYGFQCHLETTEEMIKSWASVYAKELTPLGPIHLHQIESRLHENSVELKNVAEKVFSRFAALL
jgi:GMP synthase (glutamine-hydrolysing)